MFNKPIRCVWVGIALLPFLLVSAGLPATPLLRDANELKIDKSGYVEIDADKIFYELSGKGRTIVLIHDGLVHREI